MIDDERLAAQAARGDQEAFRQIVDRTKDGMFRLACRLCGNPADAQDALQDAYLKVHLALGRGGFAGQGRLGTWIYRIVTNCCLDALRRRRPDRSDAADEQPSTNLSPEAYLALREISDWLGELPEEQRVVMVLRCIEGLSGAETAAALDISEGAVEQRLVRARARLRERR